MEHQPPFAEIRPRLEQASEVVVALRQAGDGGIFTRERCPASLLVNPAGDFGGRP